MVEKEGVIKFQLNHDYADIGKDVDFMDINAWRAIMHRLGLIGQTPEKYNGFAFGNISQKINRKCFQFLISGTQTGLLQHLSRRDYCMILEADPFRNRITSRGYSQPSSETLTHAAIYQQSSDIQCIIHAHSPEIWKHTQALNIPHTAEHIEYGTPKMAFAVTRLFKTASFSQQSILTMLGHEDGVFSFGPTMQQAAQEMIKYLAYALAVDPINNSG